MELNFTPQRVGVLIALLVIYGLLGGYFVPELPADSLLDPRQVRKAWSTCLLLFAAGAVGSTVVDHFVGTMDRTNLRFSYVLVGTAMMVGAVLWMRGLNDTTETVAMTLSVPAKTGSR